MKRVTVTLCWLVFFCCSTYLLLAKAPQGFYQTDGNRSGYNIHPVSDHKHKSAPKAEESLPPLPVLAADQGNNTTLLMEDFKTAPKNWITYNVSGSKDWQFGDDGSAAVDAYKGEGASDDWLISPPLNLDDTTDETLTFFTWNRFIDTQYPGFKVLISTDYTGSGNPGSATWQDLTGAAKLSPKDSKKWTGSGSVSLGHIKGKTVFLAFQYTSTGNGKGACFSWKVDNIIVKGVKSSTNTTNR
jgi:hypothetical protein